MAWTTPLTAVSNALWTFTQWNAMGADFLETMAGKATTAGRWFATTSSSSAPIAERVIASASETTSTGTTTSTSFTGTLTTGGTNPAVTVDTGTIALVCISASMASNSDTVAVSTSYAISGATTRAASNDWRATVNNSGAGNFNRHGIVDLATGLTAGTNTFTMNYKCEAAATGSFTDREIVVIPL